MTSEQVGCLKINCPELFKDPQFVSWLRRGTSVGGSRRYVIASWYRSYKDNPDFFDTFVTYDNGDGSDSPASAGESAMPAHCWELLDAECKRVGFKYGVLWLTNLDRDDSP